MSKSFQVLCYGTRGGLAPPQAPGVRQGSGSLWTLVGTLSAGSANMTYCLELC